MLAKTVYSGVTGGGGEGRGRGAECPPETNKTKIYLRKMRKNGKKDEKLKKMKKEEGK